MNQLKNYIDEIKEYSMDEGDGDLIINRGTRIKNFRESDYEED